MKQPDLFYTPPDITANFHHGAPESVAANPSESHKLRLQAQILDAIRDSPDGMTCDELEQRLDLPHQTCSARCSELKRDGRVIKSGTRKTRTGSSAAVLRIA